jgi:hypothetical protein
MDLIPTDPNTWLSRKVTARALTAAGLPTAAPTLASLVTRGGGPPFRINGRIAEYQWGPTLKWRESLLRYRGGDQHQDAA